MTEGLCDDTQFEHLEVIAQTATITLFMVGAFCRYRYLKNIGTNQNVVWDGLLKSKLGVYSLLILLHCICIYYKVLQLVECKLPIYLLAVEIMFIASLIFAMYLLIWEVSVRLSECWYVHKMFYALNIGFAIFMLVSYQKSVSFFVAFIVL